MIGACGDANAGCRRTGIGRDPDPRAGQPLAKAVSDPVTLKAADGTCHVRRWIRDRDCSKALGVWQSYFAL
jgi:hypothetical protein